MNNWIRKERSKKKKVEKLTEDILLQRKQIVIEEIDN